MHDFYTLMGNFNAMQESKLLTQSLLTEGVQLITVHHQPHLWLDPRLELLFKLSGPILDPLTVTDV